MLEYIRSSGQNRLLQDKQGQVQVVGEDGGLSLSVSVSVYVPYVGFNTPYITTLHFLANK